MIMLASNPSYVYFGPIWDHLNTLGSQTHDFVVWGPRWDHLNTLGSQTSDFIVWGPRWKPHNTLRTGRVIYSHFIVDYFHMKQFNCKLSGYLSYFGSKCHQLDMLGKNILHLSHKKCHSRIQILSLWKCCLPTYRNCTSSCPPALTHHPLTRQHVAR